MNVSGVIKQWFGIRWRMSLPSGSRAANSSIDSAPIILSREGADLSLSSPSSSSSSRPAAGATISLLGRVLNTVQSPRLPCAKVSENPSLVLQANP